MAYVDIAGHQTWHEVTGDGPPVVLLHGGFSGASAFFAQTPAIAQAGYRVHVPERRGHAHTADIEGPLTYSVMADDTIAYLEAQVSGPAALIGWSDGAVVALLVAQRRPELVDRMVLIGQYYNSAGRAPDDQIETLLASLEATNFLRASYDPFSPDGPIDTVAVPPTGPSSRVPPCGPVLLGDFPSGLGQMTEGRHDLATRRSGDGGNQLFDLAAAPSRYCVDETTTRR